MKTSFYFSFLKCFKKTLVFAALITIISSCAKEELTPNVGELNVTNRSSVSPIIYEGGMGGNVSCEELGTFEFTSGRNNYNDGAFENTWPSGLTVTVTEGTYVSWSYTPPAGMCVANISVIVKGGNAANVYNYTGNVQGDTDLHSPVNNGGNIAALSNLTFCWNLTPCPVPVVCQTETGYAATSAMQGPGGGGWWYYMEGGNGSAIIYAGQTMEAGTVTYTTIGGNTTFDIVLNPGWSFQNVSQPVKIHGQNTLPTSFLAPGQYKTYKGSASSVTVSAFGYYRIHLDLEYCE